MSALFKKLYDLAETLKGKKLIFILIGIFALFLLIGILVGNFTNRKLTNDEPMNIGIPGKQASSDQAGKVSFDGTVTYVVKGTYSDPTIKYVLTDAAGKDIILLKSNDEKLSVAEGLKVKVSGTIIKPANIDKDVLMVEELIMNNASN